MPLPAPRLDDIDHCSEPIGLRIIRLRHVKQRTTGIVRSFDAANKMLLHWSERMTGTMLCEYEVVYIDGRVLNGMYSFRVQDPGRPSLSRHLRSGARAYDFYEVEDFAPGRLIR